MAHLSQEERKKYEREVKYCRDMIFYDQVGNPIPGTDLTINRTHHSLILDATNRDESIQKGKMRAQEHGFDTREVSGDRIESLYRALSFGLSGTEDDYKDIYLLGVMRMSLIGNPAYYNMTKEDFRKYVIGADISGLEIVNPKALSVRFVLFNATGKDWLGQEITPCKADTVISRTAYALCVPNVNSISDAQAFAYAATPDLRRLSRDDPPDQPMDALTLDRIWRQNTIPDSFTPPLDLEERIRKIEGMPGIFDVRCFYKDNVQWEAPPRGI